MIFFCGLFTFRFLSVRCIVVYYGKLEIPLKTEKLRSTKRSTSLLNKDSIAALKSFPCSTFLTPTRHSDWILTAFSLFAAGPGANYRKRVFLHGCLWRPERCKRPHRDHTDLQLCQARAWDKVQVVFKSLKSCYLLVRWISLIICS